MGVSENRLLVYTGAGALLLFISEYSTLHQRSTGEKHPNENYRTACRLISSKSLLIWKTGCNILLLSIVSYIALYNSFFFFFFLGNIFSLRWVRNFGGKVGEKNI